MPQVTMEQRSGATKVVVATTVMLSFISFWRAAAIVLNDMASTAYYIGGIAETAIGKAAPWFILAIMLFSYAVRAVYIESCSMFVRGGVYRVVHEAMGGTLAKFSVSALMFDYVLTGPISGVSAGLYLGGLINETAESFHITGVHVHPAYFAAAFAIVVTGEESMAQVYREIAHPKLKNLEKAGFVIFLYSLLFTSLVSFFAVMIIPDAERVKYLDNLIGGLSMFLVGPVPLRLLFHGFV